MNKFHIGIVGPCNPSCFQDFFCEKKIPDIHENASSVNTFVNELLLQGHRVSVFSLYEGYSKVIEYHSDRLNFFLIPRRMKINTLSNFSSLYSIHRISEIIRRYKDDLDVLHAQWSYEYASAAQRFENDMPVFCTIRDWCPFILSFQSKFKSKVLWIIKYLIFLRVMRRQSTHFIANSKYTYSCIMKAYPSKKVEIISNPIQKEYFIDCKSTNIKYTFVSICGSVDESRKNIITLLRAFSIYKKKYNDAKLCIIGKYTPNKSIHKMAMDENLLDGVFFVGKKSHKEVFNYIDQSFCLVHPSKEETFGNILLEAIARKTLCIGGENSGAVPQVLNNGEFGLLCNVNNKEDLYQAMIKSHDKELYDQMVFKAYNYVRENYSSDVVVYDTIRIYSKYLK